MAWQRAADIGKRLKALREALGLTQEDFGELVGVTGQSISDYEGGRSRPSRSRLERLARQVGIPVTGFAKGGPMPQALLKRPAVPSNSDHPLGIAGSASWVLTADERPPTGKHALTILELEMELAVAKGRTVSREELLAWLALAKASREPDGGGATGEGGLDRKQA